MSVFMSTSLFLFNHFKIIKHSIRFDFSILVNCPKLQLLDLSFCDNIMDRDVSRCSMELHLLFLS